MSEGKRGAIAVEGDRRWAQLNEIERIVSLFAIAHVEFGMHVQDEDIKPYFDATRRASERLGAYLNERGVPLWTGWTWNGDAWVRA